MDEPTKKCSDCKIVKPVSKFHASGRTKDGYYRRCKACRKVADSKNPSKVKDYINKNMYGLTPRDY